MINNNDWITSGSSCKKTKEFHVSTCSNTSKAVQPHQTPSTTTAMDSTKSSQSVSFNQYSNSGKINETENHEQSASFPDNNATNESMEATAIVMLPVVEAIRSSVHQYLRLTANHDKQNNNNQKGYLSIVEDIERNYGYRISHPVLNIRNDGTNDLFANMDNQVGANIQQQQQQADRWKVLAGRIRDLERIKNDQNHAIQMDTNATWTRHQKSFFKYYENNNGRKCITAEEYEHRYYTHVIQKNKTNTKDEDRQHSNPWGPYFATLKRFRNSQPQPNISSQERENSRPKETNVLTNEYIVSVSSPISQKQSQNQNQSFQDENSEIIQQHQVLVKHSDDHFRSQEEERVPLSSGSNHNRRNENVFPEVVSKDENAIKTATIVHRTESFSLPFSLSSLPDRDEPSHHPELAATEERLWKAMDEALAEYSST